MIFVTSSVDHIYQFPNFSANTIWDGLCKRTEGLDSTFV